MGGIPTITVPGVLARVPLGTATVRGPPGKPTTTKGIGKNPRCSQKHMEGHTAPILTWHPWGRIGAAAYKQLGGTLAALADWARWGTQRQAAHYAQGLAGCKFQDTWSSQRPPE